MFEASADPRTKAAIEKAHAERGSALRWLVRALMGPRDLPLNRPVLSGPVLTGSSRCPN